MKTYDELLESMQNTYTLQTGVDPNDASDIGIRLKVLAGELFSLYGQIEALNKQLFPQTSTAEHLDMHAELRGHQRRASSFAQGILTFRREQPAPTAIEIPLYTLAATTLEPHFEYYTTKKAFIEQGSTSVSVPALAAVGGKEGNVAVGKVSLLMDMLPGVSKVENTTPFFGGNPQETDEELRKRLVHSYRNISNGANAAYYYDLAASKAGVRAVAVLPRKRGRGTVDVVITGENPAGEQALANDLLKTLGLEKEVNVDVAVYPATPKVVALRLGILVHPEHDYEVMKAQCEQVVRSFFEAIGIGNPLRLAHLGKRLLELDGLENYLFLAPVADVLPLAQESITLGALVLERQVG